MADEPQQLKGIAGLIADLDSGRDLRLEERYFEASEKQPWRGVWIQIWDDEVGKYVWYFHGLGEKNIFRALKIKTDWPEPETIGDFLKKKDSVPQSRLKKWWLKFKKLFAK